MEKEYVRIQWENRPSISTPLGKTNLNKMDYQIDKNENTLITFDTTKANQSDLLQTIRTLTYDTETGIFVFTFWNGSTYSVDLNIEKIPVTFSMDEYGVITMTTADGTTYTCDIGALIKLYTFVDGDEIDFVTTTDAGGNKTITASIKDGSIVGSKLQPNFLADCQAAKAQAELAATSASSDASDAELSSEDSEAWAVGERNGQPVPSTDPAYENNAKWWAQHGTGSSFAGLTDTNFTNLQNGQIAKYDSATQKWINTEDEGGLLPHFKITSEAGSTVTVVCPDTSIIVPTQTSSGIWQCDVPSYGVYTVHAVINGDDAVRTVTVDTVKEYVIHDEHYSYTLNVYAPTGSSIIVTDNGSETYTGTGAGSTAVVFALHQASTLYHITVTYDGLDIDTTITSSATSGGSGSKTITFGTINLTVDEDLIGETIVMAKGTDTVSKVASSTSMVFYPNATGNWRISVDYEGETVYAEPDPIVVSSLSTPVSAELSLVKIPEGATVLPTDDIQTWLACANITDKSYTTLAEVLADRETFETLIADSNACDYMARSTSWAGSSEGLVPTMTSNTQPSGECFASSLYSSSYAYYYAFDNDSSTLWYSSVADAVGSTIGYDFGTPVIVDKVRITSSTNTANNPTNVTVQGYDTEWHDIATFSRSALDTTTKFDNSTPYTKYRIKTNAFSGTTGTNTVAFSALQFYYAGIITDADAMSLIGKYDYCSNALLSNATWAEAICNSDYVEEVLNAIVPAMTSNSTPAGYAIAASSVYQNNATYDAWKAFDDNFSTNWHSDGSAANPWIYCLLPTPIKAYKVRFTPSGASNNSYVKRFQICGSNDGSTWDVLLDTTAPNSIGQILDFVIPNENVAEYLYYRMQCIGTNWNNTNPCSLYELEYYGRASSNVSNTNGIIHTAMGNESVYCVETGDTFTATDGIATVDFSDFDEGVYTFGSTTAKNPNDLSEDFKKRFRITKSPYGGTTERYLLPDTIDTLYWYGYEDEKIEDATSANGWSGTQSSTYVAPTHNTLDIYCNSSGNYNFQAITTKQPIAGASKIHSIMLPTTGAIGDASQKGYLRNVSSKSYDNTLHYYNFSTTSLEHGQVDTSNDSNFYIFNGEAWGAKGYIKALWYDRISSDIPTFISAANDTLYIMDGNNKIYVANTNGESKSYEPLLEAGTYTIYSSVAKDPNNLSNPYSKTITITEATQTVAVMPENTLYWWGYMSSNLETMSTTNGWTNTGGYTYGTPTYNKNSILFTGASSKVVGVGSKTTIAMNTLYSVTNGIAGSYLCDSAAKTHGSPHAISTNSSGVQAKFSLSVNGTRYAWTGASDGGSSTLYALWYE